MNLEAALKLKDKVIIGTDRTMKALRKGEIKEIFISSNFPENKLKEIESASKVQEVSINRLKMNSEELGAKCRKPFSVVMVGLLN